jgi:hypothetical protein
VVLGEPSSRAGRQPGFFSGVTNILHPNKIAHAAGTGASIAVESCQICGHTPLDNVLSLGYMPPPNRLTPVGQSPKQQSWYPTDFLYCKNCGLAQLGLVIDPAIVFPPEFPYTTGNTKALRDNFVELYRESSALLGTCSIREGHAGSIRTSVWRFFHGADGARLECGRRAAPLIA